MAHPVILHPFVSHTIDGIFDYSEDDEDDDKEEDGDEDEEREPSEGNRDITQVLLRQQEAKERKEKKRKLDTFLEKKKKIEEKNKYRDKGSDGPNDDISVDNDTCHYNSSVQLKDKRWTPEEIVPSQWEFLLQESSLQVHKEESAVKPSVATQVIVDTTTKISRVPFDVSNFFDADFVKGKDGKPDQDANQKILVGRRAFVPYKIAKHHPKILRKTGTSDDVDRFIALRTKGGPSYSRVFHKFTNMELGELDENLYQANKNTKIKGGSWVLALLDKTGATKKTSFHMFRPNCDDNCNCLAINAAIINGAWNKNNHPSSKWNAIVPTLSMLDELESMCHDPTVVFQQIDKKQRWAYWKCSKDLELCILFNRAFVEFKMKSSFQTRYCIRGVDHQGTLEDGSHSVFGGLVPLCEKALCFLINRRDLTDEAKAPKTGTGLKLLRTVAVPRAPGQNANASVDRDDGTPSYANYMCTHGGFSGYTETIFRMLVEAICVYPDAKKVIVGHVPKWPAKGNDWLFKSYIEGTLLQETLDAPLSEDMFLNLSSGIRHLMGVRVDMGKKLSDAERNSEQLVRGSNFCIADQRLQYHLAYNSNVTNILLRIVKQVAFQTVLKDPTLPITDENYYIDLDHWDVDEVTGKPKMPVDRVVEIRHLMDVCVEQVPKDALQTFTKFVNRQVRTVPNKDGTTTIFGQAMKPFCPSIPNWYMATIESSDWESTNDCFSTIIDSDGSVELKTHMESMRRFLQERALSMFCNVKKAETIEDYVWQMNLSILQGRLDTKVSVWTAPHSPMSRISQAVIGGFDGFTAFARFPIQPHGAFFRLYQSQSDSRGHLIFCSEGSAVLGPMSALQDFGHISNIEGNRQAFVSIVAIPKSRVNDFNKLKPPGNYISVCSTRTYPHLDRSIKGFNNTGATSSKIHDTDGHLTETTEKDLCVPWVHEYPRMLWAKGLKKVGTWESNKIASYQGKAQKILDKEIKTRMAMFMTPEYDWFHKMFR